MDSKDAKECSICQEEFDELQRCPRILPCAHCICTQCITDLIIRNLNKCPLCRKAFFARSALELGVNTIFLDLLKLVKKIETSPISPALSRGQIVEAIKKKSINMNLKHIKVSQEETDLIKEMINDNQKLKENILMKRGILTENIMNQIKDLDARLETEVEYLDIQNQRLEDRLKELEAKDKELEDAKESLEGVTSFKMLDDALDEAEAFNAASQTWFENIKRKTSSEEKIRQGMKENLECTSELIGKIRRVLESPVAKQRDLEDQREAIMQLDNIAGELTWDMLQNPSPAMKGLASLDGIYAIQDNGGNIKGCSKITFSWDKKIFLHCLTEQEVPQHVVTIQHDDVMSHVDISSRTTFLELGAGESKLGRILINMTPDTKRAQNFSLLCSGSKGPSYLNTKFLKVLCKGIAGEYVMSGYCTSNDYSWGNELVSGAAEEEWDVLECPDFAGTVGGLSRNGDSDATRFWITTRDNPDNIYPATFGKVKSGLHAMRYAVANYPDIEEVRVIDCGVVLPAAQ